MRKIILLSLLFMFCLFNLNAQNEDNIQLRIETGILPLSKDNKNLGFFINAEPKVKVSDDLFFGLRVGVVLNSHRFDNYNNDQFIIDSDHNNAVLSFVPNLDYYLNDDYFRPYIGVGLGYHILANYIDVFRTTNASEGVLEGNVKKRLGFLLRGGFESGKWRFGLEYNYVPKAEIEIANSQIIGSVINSYFGLSVGSRIGGGTNSKE